MKRPSEWQTRSSWLPCIELCAYLCGLWTARKYQSASRRNNIARPAQKGQKRSQKLARTSVSVKNVSRAANVGRVMTVVNQAPRQQVLPNGNLLVSHREFIGKIPGSVNYSVVSEPVNPGLPVQFKWLYPIANQYESYRFRKLQYQFVNSKAGTFAGDVILGIDYDASDATPFNEDELQTYWGCKTGQICEPMTFTADVAALHKLGPSKFVRMGSLASNQDIKLYDSGNFFVATTDCADTSTIGRLFVDYIVELMTPSFTNTPFSVTVAPTGESQGSPLGTAFVQLGTNSCTWLSATTFSFDVPGQYLCSWVGVGTVITAGPRITSNTGASVYTNGSAVVDSGALNVITLQFVKISSASDVFTVASTATTLTAVQLRVDQHSYVTL